MQLAARFLILLFENLTGFISIFYFMHNDHQKVINRKLNSYITKLRKGGSIVPRKTSRKI